MRWTQSVLGLLHEAGLIAGRAPARWRERLGRETERLDDLPNACSWIGSWKTTGEMLLCRDPLLGHTLEALTGYQKTEGLKQARPIVPDILPHLSGNRENQGYKELPLDPHPWTAHASRAFDKIPFGERYSSRPDRNLRSKEKKASMSGMMHSPLHMDKRASRAILCHLAGEANLSESSVQPLARAIPGPDARATPIISWDAKSHQIWMHDMSSRALSSLLQKEIEAFESPGSAHWSQISENYSPLHMDKRASRAILCHLAGEANLSESSVQPLARAIPGPDARATPIISWDAESHQIWMHDMSSRALSSLLQKEIEAFEPPGSAHWSQIGENCPLISQRIELHRGSKAPMDLLAYLASPPVKNRTECYRRTVENGSKLRTEEASRSSGRPFGEALPQMQQAVSQPFGGVDQISDIDGKLQMPSRIAPPRAALSLPDLLPSQITEMPSLPVASASARLGAKLEADAVVDDNQDVLAAKIKRILDEEARRHGIDV